MNRPLRPAVAGLALLLSLPIHATGQESEIGITAEVRVQNGDVLRARLLQESLRRKRAQCQRRSKIGPKGGVKLVHFL